MRTRRQRNLVVHPYALAEDWTRGAQRSPPPRPLTRVRREARECDLLDHTHESGYIRRSHLFTYVTVPVASSCPRWRELRG